MEDYGITTQVFFNNTYQWNVNGGRALSSHNGATIDWLVTADFERMDLMTGGRGLIHVRREWGDGVNPFVGSLWQVQDDQDGDRSLYIAQLWYEQNVIRNKLWLKFGFLDYQTIVDRNVFANNEDKQFMNQALDDNPLLPLNIGLGAALTYKPCDWFTLITGIGDAFGSSRKGGFSTAFHGPRRFVWFTETAFHVKWSALLGRGPLDGNYRFGVVYDPRPRTVFAPLGTDPAFIDERGNDFGYYVNFDQRLYKENVIDDQGLGWFLRYGFRHGDINQVQNFWSTGFAYQGLIPSRDRDVLGIAVFQSIPSRRFNDRVNSRAEAETGFEMFYAMEITRWLVITPDIQYISSPGIDSSLDDAVVLGIRARISF